MTASDERARLGNGEPIPEALPLYRCNIAA